MEREFEYTCAARLQLVEVELVSVEVSKPPLTVKTPDDAVRALEQLIGSKDREHLVAMHLDARNQVVSFEVISKGTTTAALVHPREVMKAAILSNASAFILAHNHPSGDPSPSTEDKEVLKRMHAVGKLIGIPMVDFIIVSPGGNWIGRETAHWPTE